MTHAKDRVIKKISTYWYVAYKIGQVYHILRKYKRKQDAMYFLKKLRSTYPGDWAFILIKNTI